MKSFPLASLRKRFRREWLLIAVDKMDDVATIPLTGHLLFHSPHRDEVYRKSRNKKAHLLIVYSEDTFPEGYAAAF
ncbi:MAG: hypothetical protein HY748_16520 [Elusimicrobia bacterium]|nr:hypothetical protein [Elusimicrobiota bacterium]